ncbi:MAG: PepSY domain-containing protein [Euryarchaeota archaeon]|nr:PepSY domain-containing protein [Euryarchaeota archaeon]
MKKILFTILMVSVLVISVTGCVNTDDKAPGTSDEAVPHTGSEPSSGNENPSSMGVISLDRAKEIALDHAGLAETDVTFVNAKLDTDDGKPEYEIEFYSGNTEYDYDIDPYTGDILSYDSDVENYSASGSVQSDNKITYIGEEKAKSIALAKVPGATESDIRLALDSDDGNAVYEGSILFDDMEYEFEIDAAAGTIVDWSAEPINDD